MSVRCLLLYVSSLTFLSLSVWAQGDFATLTGSVSDKAEAVVPGVKVSVTNVDTGIARSMLTTETGDYTITNLPPGHYELVAEHEGFHKYRKTGIVLEIGENMRADIPLELGSVTESVNVTAQVAVLNTESGTIKGEVIVQQEIENLPLDGRDFTDLAFLVPGVMPTAQGGQGSALAINGARSDSRRGQRFLASAHGLVQGALGGWNLSGTASFATGSPITVLTNGSNQNIGEFPRPNRVATGIPADQPGKRGVDYPWFDVNAFQPVPACISVAKGCPPDAYGFLPFQDGNSGRNILDGPGYQYINMALMKNFPVSEHKIIQFRLESFNIFNHPNLMLPDNNFNTTTAGLISSAVETGRGGPRVFQASLKFMF